jgi:uncharacterized protein YbaP (TraB family)
MFRLTFNNVDHFLVGSVHTQDVRGTLHPDVLNTALKCDALYCEINLDSNTLPKFETTETSLVSDIFEQADSNPNYRAFIDDMGETILREIEFMPDSDAVIMMITHIAAGRKDTAEHAGLEHFLHEKMTHWKVHDGLENDSVQVAIMDTLRGMTSALPFRSLADNWLTSGKCLVQMIQSLTTQAAQDGNAVIGQITSATFQNEFLFERNQTMATKIAELLSNNTNEYRFFFVVGCGHLFGEKTIVDFLPESISVEKLLHTVYENIPSIAPSPSSSDATTNVTVSVNGNVVNFEHVNTEQTVSELMSFVEH